MTKAPGISNGRLKSCPKSPNCVSTQSTQQAKKIDPLTFSDDIEGTYDLVLKSIESFGNTRNMYD